MSRLYEKPPAKAPAIGIDLGTTFSCVGVWSFEHDRVDIVPNKLGNYTTPSCVAFTEDEGIYFVGEEAKDGNIMNAHNTVFDVKRLMGTRFDDSTVQKDIKSWPFTVKEGSEMNPMIVVKHNTGEKAYTPEFISSLILLDLKTAAEAFLQAIVSDAVITVPAYFNEKQRQATISAAKFAGLNVLRLISEPTAAAVAFGFEKVANRNSSGVTNVFVFDLGGGTFDASIVEISPCGREISVKAVDGNTHLGGEDFNTRMVEHCVAEFKKMNDMDISEDNVALTKLRVSCEKAKRELSKATQATIKIASLCEGVDFSLVFSRDAFEDLNRGFFNQCVDHVRTCLANANMQPSEIHEVVMVGGSTRIPRVREMVMEFFVGKALCLGIHLDEIVAYGASVMAANLNGTGIEKVRDVVVQDIIPVSLGTDVFGGGMDFLIKSNTRIPVTSQRVYKTTQDYQTKMSIQVYRGDNKLLKDNMRIAEFSLEDIPPAPAGVEKVTVCFKVDKNGTLSVSAESHSTGVKRTIKVLRRI